MQGKICLGSRQASKNEFTAEDRRVKCHVCGKVVPITGYSAMYKHRLPNTLDLLNSYGGDNLWEDVIYKIPGYDEDATVRAYEDRNPAYDDVVVIGEEMFVWNQKTRQWKVS